MTEFSLNKEFENLIKQTIGNHHLREIEKNKVTAMDESSRNQDFFQDNNYQKRENIKPYTTTRIKSRNFLSNISYVRANKEDFYNKGLFLMFTI